MKIGIKKIILTAVLTLPVFCLGFDYRGDASLIATSPDVTPQMLDAEYWIDRYDNPDEIIMTQSEIVDMNNYVKTKLSSEGEPYFELTTYANNFSVDDKAKILKSLSAIPKKKYYNNGLELKEDFWKEIISNCNVDAKADDKVYLSICIKNSDLKLYPTDLVLSDTPGATVSDENMNSEGLLGEGFAIIHRSSDGKWCYGCTDTAFGWTKTENLAVCGDASMWDFYMNASDFLVCTANRITLDMNRTNSQTSGLEITMGTKLVLPPSGTAPYSVGERIASNSYVVIVPTRNEQGGLEFSYCMVPYSADVSHGYLPYTTRNVLNQAFKTQGDRYGWGGDLGRRDCSSYAKDVYRCFGIFLPRNSTTQTRLGTDCLTWDDTISVEEKMNQLQKVRPGAIMRFPGHVMIYLGQANGKAYVISALGSYCPVDKSEIVYVRGVNVNSADVLRASGKTWLECITHVMFVTKNN